MGPMHELILRHSRALRPSRPQRRHGAPGWGVLFAWVWVLCSLPAGAQEPPPPPEPKPQTRVEVQAPEPEEPSATERTEELYRQLFRTSTELSRAEEAARRDSLRAEVALLEARIARLREQLESEREVDEEARAQGRDWAKLEEEIRASAEEGDAEGFNRQLEVLLKSMEDMGVDLGEHLGHVQLEISAERFRLATEGGGYIDVAIPEEVQENLRKGAMVFSQELGRALSDSVIEQWGKELGDISQDKEGALSLLKRLRPDRKQRKWKVIGSSVFKAGTPYRVAEDELVKGDVVVMGGRLQVDGKVLGKAVSVAGDLEITGSGVVEGDAVSFGGNVISQDGASIGGQVIDFGRLLPGAEGVRGATPYLNIVMLALRLAVMAVLALILLALMGDRLDAMCAACEGGLGRPFGMGFIWLLVALVLFSLSAFTLALTIIGIPVVILLGVVFGALLLAAYFVSCRLLGRRILAVLGAAGENSAWQSILIGLVVLEGPAILLVALSLVIAPDGSAMALPRTVDLILKFLALSLGFGCVINSRLGALHGRAPRAEATSPAPS